MHSLTLFSAIPPVFFYVPLLVVAICLTFHYLIYSRRVAQWRKSNIPFLRPSFLIGHKYFLNLYKNSPLVSLDRIYKENSDKDVVGFFLATMPMVMIRNPTLIKQVFSKNFDKTFETGLVASRKDEVSQNMPGLCADKDLWKSNRITLSPIYSSARIGGEQFAKMKMQIERLWAHAEGACLNGKPIDARQISFNFAEDATSQIFFGLEANSYKKQGEVLQLVTNLCKPSLRRMFSVYAQMQFPGAQMFSSLKFIAKKHADSMASLIRKQIEFKSQHKSNENDFVDFLMTLKDGGKANKQNSEIDVSDQMVGYGLTIIFGRMDSIAILGSFAIHLLSLHPKHQERIRKEVSEVMQKHKTSEFTYEVVQDLHFTDQCLQETARLYPSLPAITRVCSEDFKVPGTDHTFKKGERVIMDPYSVHRDPKYFKNPDEFDPERFSPQNRSEITPDSLLILGSGPRKCPGGKLGFLMVATLLASLLHKYEIKPRSHVKQMDATDFHPLCFTNIHREDILVDIIPCGISAQ